MFPDQCISILDIVFDAMDLLMVVCLLVGLLLGMLIGSPFKSLNSVELGNDRS